LIKRIRFISNNNKFLGNSSLFKVRSVTVGRLLVDTYLNARELVREPDYSLEHLSKIHLSKDRKIKDPDFFEKAFDSCDDLFELVDNTAYDAFLTMELMGKLQILPLTKELTNIAGNLWIKSLQNSRAERNEMLLMHEFFQQNYLFPDKYQFNYEDKALLEEEKNEKKNKKTQKYSGGLVLEPKKGLYDKYILLLDFNSLYPSLIQEYNICFTTVKRPSIPLENILVNKKKNKTEGEENNEEIMDPNEIIVDIEKKNSILPRVIKNLVEKRRAVKNQLKKAESIEEKQNLDIKQKAIKLIANSIYG
jgi:DNA polymerase alpha subunit A